MKVALVGAGVVGRNLARALAARGDQITVLSPRAVELPALWCQCDAITGQGLRKGLRGADVVVFAASGRGKQLQELGVTGLGHVARATPEGARLVVVGPAGKGDSPLNKVHLSGLSAARKHRPDLLVLRLPALFGEDDHLVGHWLQAVRQGAPLVVRDAGLELRPLFVGDAMRLLLAAVDGELPADAPIEVTGADTLTVQQLAQAFEHRFECSRRLLPLGGRSPDRVQRACLQAQLAARDQWDELELGPRTRVAAFLEQWSKLHLGA